MFVARLEKLNLSYDFKAFVNCKKPALIESLLKSCGHIPDGINFSYHVFLKLIACSQFKGLSLIVDLCLAYDYFPSRLWSALLKQVLIFTF